MRYFKFQLILLFPLLVLLQVFLLNHINLWGFIDPQIYILYLIIFPFATSPLLFMPIALLIGLSIDILLNLPGQNAIACLTVSYLRPLMIKVFYGTNYNNQISLYQYLNVFQKLKFVVTLILVHHFIFFLIDYIGVRNFSNFITYYIATCCCTFLVIWILLRLNINRNERE